MSQSSEHYPLSSIAKPSLGRLALLVMLVFLVLGGAAAWLNYYLAQAHASLAQDISSIVGAWRVDAQGAPFVPHVALFFTDGTFLIDNPEAGDQHTSDSLGAGAWERVPQHPDTIIGTFEEINADRASGHYASLLEVTFTLTMRGANVFTGPAEATYYTPDGMKQNVQPYPATLTGTRIQP